MMKPSLTLLLTHMLLLCFCVGCDPPANVAVDGEAKLEADRTLNLQLLPAPQLKKIRPEDFKEDVVGEASAKLFNIYWDKSEPNNDLREIWLIKISNSSVKVDAERTWAKLLEDFPK